MTPARARTRRRAAGLAASLGVHLALLAAFMGVAPRLVTVPHLESPSVPAIRVELQRVRRNATGPASRPAHAADTPAEPLPFPPRPMLRPSELPPASAFARPHPAASTALDRAVADPHLAAGDKSGDGRWRVSGASDGAGEAARALARGTVGCGAATYLHLTADERDHCNTELVRGMRTLKVDAIPAGKRAYYDQVAAAAADARGMSPFDALHQRQLNEQARDHSFDVAAQARCAIRFGPGAARANRDDPCRLHLPLSPLTAETRVPPPPTLADRTADEKAAAKLDPPPAPR